MMARVLAVIVTHNRLELLKRCIVAVQSQCYRSLELLVVDNDSTDGTRDYLIQKGIQTIHQANGGASEGWRTGITAAKSDNFDFVWLMDDDGFPASDALSNLVGAIEADDACISSVVLIETDRDRLVFPLPILNIRTGNPSLRLGRRKLFTLEDLGCRGHLIDYPFAHLFNGALLPVRVVKAIGNIDADYFIYGEELDYLYRLRRVGKIRSLIKARHYHPDVSTRPLNASKFYHYIRNTIIINYRYLDYSFIRSCFTIIVGCYRSISRNGVGVFLTSQITLVPIAIRDAVNRLNAKV